MRFPGVVAIFVAVSALVWAAPVTSQQPTAAGLWEQSDDKGVPESWFKIAEKDGVYSGTVVKMFQKPGDPPPESWRCAKCEGAKKNAPVIGLTLIEGMKRNGLKYEDGTILDSRDGNVWRALMQVSPDGRQLEVRGYLRFEWAGRSQIWNRLPDNAMAPPNPPPGAPKAPPFSLGR